MNTPPRLSGPEHEAVIDMAKSGKTIAQIADDMSCRADTVALEIRFWVNGLMPRDEDWPRRTYFRELAAAHKFPWEGARRSDKGLVAA